MSMTIFRGGGDYKYHVTIISDRRPKTYRARDIVEVLMAVCHWFGEPGDGTTKHGPEQQPNNCPLCRGG